jgi:molybdopterin-containing oxidoreductase family molybdopterin binding subunit
MKLVVFGPMCNSPRQGYRMDPLVPGTDGAVILAMCNVILNELGVWDAEYLKLKTNGPYLAADGRCEIKQGNRWSGTRPHQRPGL